MPGEKDRPQAPGKWIVLLGMPGSGKSTCGRLLSSLTGMDFVDSDEEIEREQGMTIPEIFQQVGERGFREIESAYLRGIDPALTPRILATGGGMPLAPANFALLAALGRMVYLYAPLETLADRLALSVNRPLLARTEVQTMKEKLAELLAARRPTYERAHLKIDTSGLPADRVAQAIIEALHINR